jgi:hypothetical protein
MDNKTKQLIFEGAGWEIAEHNGVGNCRIRTRLTNKEGKFIYLEMSGNDISNSRRHPYKKEFPFIGYVQHCFESDDNEHSEYRKLENVPFHYSKSSILSMVNEKLNCDYTELVVINDNSVRVHDTKKPLC